MTTPAADCGVSGGCRDCPLGRAGVCGDPETELPGMWEFADFTGGLDEVRRAPVDTLAEAATEAVGELFDRAALPRALMPKPCETSGALRVARGDNGQGVRMPEEWAKAQGLVILDPGGWHDKPWSAPITRAEFLRRAMTSTVARFTRSETDTPDLDPAEPRPADAGCCGGGCGG